MTPVSDPNKVKIEIIPEFRSAMEKSGRDPSRAYVIGFMEFGAGDVQALVQLLKSSSAAQGLIDEARDETDPRRIQELGSRAPDDLVIKHHHLVSRVEELVPAVQELVSAGCNYIVFADQSRRPDEHMRDIMADVVPSISAR